MNIFYQHSSGEPDRPSGAGSDFVTAQIRHHREAKRTLKRQTAKKMAGTCECGGSVAEAAASSNDTLITKYKSFEIHAVNAPNNEDAPAYYAKHPTLGRMGRTDSLEQLKRLIDKTASKVADTPVMVSGRAAQGA